MQKKRFQLSYIVICKNYVKIMLYQKKINTSGQREIRDRRYSPRALGQTLCDSRTDSKVWMEEDVSFDVLLSPE